MAYRPLSLRLARSPPEPLSTQIVLLSPLVRPSRVRLLGPCFPPRVLGIFQWHPLDLALLKIFSPRTGAEQPARPLTLQLPSWQPHYSSWLAPWLEQVQPEGSQPRRKYLRLCMSQYIILSFMLILLYIHMLTAPKHTLRLVEPPVNKHDI